MSESLIGHRLGAYEILDLLGRGGMGSVYLAERVDGRERVAIKVIAPHVAGNPQVAARFEAEARAVTRIDHPNVIKILDYGVLADGTLYHVLELLTGVELTQLMEQKRVFSAEELAPFVEQICQGLQAAHDAGVVHRDLKPENIRVLSVRPLALKIFDFGIAKLLEPGDWVKLTMTGMALGTPLVIAPEQALGERELIGPRTDLYSLGVLLYWMLGGAPPFEDGAPGLLLARHIKDLPPPLRERRPAVPQAVAEVVHGCLEKDPARRPASAREVWAVYLAALEGEGGPRHHDHKRLAPGLAGGAPAPLSPPPILQRAPEQPRSWRLLTLALVSGALLIVALLALIAYMVAAG